MENRRQRGIYSEVLTHEETEALQPQATTGPSSRLTTHPSQRLPRARGLGRRRPGDMQEMSVASEQSSGIYTQKRAGVADVDPKVFEPFAPIPARAPRKVVIDRKKKLYASLKIDELLKDHGIEYEEPINALLPLEPFDDCEFEERNPEEWIEAGKSGSIFESVPGLGLQKDIHDPNICHWKPVLINQYDAEKEVFIGVWDATKTPTEVPKINLLFLAEDPYLFASRVASAHQEREWAESLIKYNFFIDNMPTEEIHTLDSDQKARLVYKATNVRGMKKEINPENSPLVQEVNFDFARTMNKIIFDKHMQNSSKDTIQSNLKLPPPPPPQPVPEFAMVQIPQHDFPEQFSNFCFNSLYIKEEVIASLERIREQCIHTTEKEIYATQFTTTMSLAGFGQVQSGSISSIGLYLNQWKDNIQNIIQTSFQDIGKGWFNLHETAKETYEFGKLKKYLTMVKLMMQDSLFTLTHRSTHRFVQSLEEFIPFKVEIGGPKEVKNEFKLTKNQEEVDPDYAKNNPPIPLIAIDIIKGSPTSFKYSKDPIEVIEKTKIIFEDGLKIIKTINSIEEVVMEHLFKKQDSKTKLKVPVLTVEAPIPPTAEEKKTGKLPDENTWVWNLRERLVEIMHEAIQPLYQYLAVYDRYEDVMKLSPEKYIKELEEGEDPWTVDQVRDKILEHQQLERTILDEIPETIRVSCFEVHLKDVRNTLSGKHTHFAKILTELIAQKARNINVEMLEEFRKLHRDINKPPQNIEELVEIKDLIARVPQDIERMKQEIEKNMRTFTILESFGYKFSNDDLYKKWDLFGFPKRTHDLISVKSEELDKQKVVFQEQMLQEQEDFQEAIADLENIVNSFIMNTDINQYKEVAEMVQRVNVRLNECVAQAKKYNHHEYLFGMDVTDYSQVNTCVKEFKPYSDLWLTIDKFYDRHQHWMNDEWETLNGREIEDTVDNSIKTIATVQKVFGAKGAADILPVVDKIKKDVDHFKQFVRLAVAMRKPGMCDRHWDQISNHVGFEVRPHEGFTLTTVIDMGLKKWEDFIEDVGERAYKEYQIETKLNEMEKAWEGVEFEVMPAKGTDTFILGGLEPIQNLLDEHIMQTQNFYFSAFKKPFEDRIEEWSKTLMLVQDIIEEWFKCQINWMYLNPIFDSKDIMKQLPTETKKFRSVDGTWRHTMTQVNASKNVIKTCKKEGRLEALREANRTLEAVQKELNNYLETKRAAFARFYFLSNEELLSILSDTKDPTLVEHHLRKVFENMNKLDFHEDLTIHAMYSGEGERVDFFKPLDPKDKNVEHWMSELELMMKASVRWALKVSIEEYPNTPRTEWVLQHPGQCVLNGSQFHWTAEVEEAIEKGIDAVADYHKQLSEQLMETVALVRGELSLLQSITCGALIVIDVHAMDVVQRLIKNQVHSIEEFDWISQLRYYWEDDECWVKCIQTRFPYGYEYLGNTPRLVITELTDKCYMTLMGALHLNLGGAPAGPAGTGKTESVKDLSKALAKQVVVFNCSEDMDYIMVGKFFKGLASSGAWACFDEFNRIDIEVLSVIAQQLQTLLEKKRQNEVEFEFEGSTIRMQPTFSVFITMNPGYAGRTELPDNLKALFRSVAMMVPDYAVIGEIMLYSFGFMKARDLAKKMVATFKLSSEQLSSQDHYDYGMRAVRSVINAAGLIKRDEPDLDEEKLLLRALRDVNVPKFLKDDLPLFENIILDLFPGVEKPEMDRSPLDEQVVRTCEKLNLQATDIFIGKIFQLYDTIQVRHGLMIVGPTGGGKSSNYRVLAQAMSSLKHLPKFDEVFLHILNPKSITMGQLYGKFDELTHEWSDGILAYLIRKCVKDMQNPPHTNKHWVMFDGPVDALWIENMNTVLDDNKKLCLNSGEIIPLTQHMRMMFEVEDLAVASPATVSRCGMVYMEPVSLGLEPLVTSWLNTLPEKVDAHPGFKERLAELFDVYAHPMIRFVRKHLKEPVMSMDNNLLQSVCRLLNCHLVNFKDSEIRIISPEEITELYEHIEHIFVYCIIWALGVTTTNEGRRRFDLQLRDILQQRKLPVAFPDDDTVYEWHFDYEEKVYKTWIDTIEEYEVDTSLNFNEIVVPTMESIRLKHAYKLLLTNKYHVLSPGPTGTGKSINSESLLMNEMPSNFQYIALTFSAKTSANQTQDLIDGKMTRRKNKVYGPAAGKYFVIFVDDLNMPRKEVYGAQPPLELLRQWMDHEGWYNRKELIKFDIVDIVFLSAMGPPGGGRSTITNRLVRHFNIMTYTNIESSDVTMIFNKILSALLRPYAEPVRNLISKIVQSTIDIYNEVEQTLLPIPSKSHYIFNLRDMAKVFSGVCSSDQKVLKTALVMIRLWCHENLRVFGDRLISDEDRDWLFNLLSVKVESDFGMKATEVFSRERLIFCHFLNSNLPEEQRIYEEVTDTQELMNIMNDYLDNYNDRYPKKQMKLVIFLDACCHVARVSRILRQPQGNALLLGVGGSGRQSLTKLSAFLMDTEIRQIEITKSYNMNQWRDDLKACLKYAGIKNERVIFLFVDTQIIDDQMLEDINNVLNSGDVPNLYKADDWEEIEAVGKPECQRRNLQLTEMNIMTQYLARVKKNIRIVLAMSPIGEAFRSNLRMFPSLINCCTIDWFTDWPEEALISVAKGQLTEEDLSLDDQFDSIVLFFKSVHKSVEISSNKFKAELRRYNYVTPTSYLELLRCFKNLLVSKRNEVETQKSRFQGGVFQLEKASQLVSEMAKELEEMKPELAEAQRQSVIMMEQIAKDKIEAEETQRHVAKDEAEAQEKTDQAETLQAQGQKELDEALPMLYKALESLNQLKRDHFVEVRSFSNPPGGVVITMEAICQFFNVRPLKKKDPVNFGKQIEDYWEPAKSELLKNPNQLLDQLKGYDRDGITQDLIDKISPKVHDEEFTPEKVAKASKACEAMCKWVHAMYNYYHVNLRIEPIRQRVAELNEEVAEAQAMLKQAKARLKEVTDKIEALEKAYEETMQRQEQLMEKINDCEVKMERADKLIGGLGGERQRWTEEVKQLTFRLTLLPGDCALSAGMVAYSGPFTRPYRQDLEHKWQTELVTMGIRHSKEVTMRETLGDPVAMQQWKVAGLPSDPVSIENGIIIEKARRWPLMIDPQMQANNFIKKLGKEHEEGIEFTKASDSNLMKLLGQAVMNGKWFLVENVGQELDPALEPILLQQIVKEGAGYTIRIGDKNVEYSRSFRFFMTTTLPNPHYSPETCVKVTLLNFAITPEGLEEQMMAIVVAKENAQLEETKSTLIAQQARAQKDLKAIEDQILELLSSSEGNILENQELIDTLSASKQTSTNLEIKVKEAKQTELEIDAARESYRPVAFRASLLFFSIIDLSSINSMYQYSLQWFIKLFEMGIDNAPNPSGLEERLESLNSYFTYSLYQNVCRSLFERDKLMFSFTLAVKILQGDNEIDPFEWRHLLTGPQGTAVPPPNPTIWLNDNQWSIIYQEIHAADQLDALHGLEQYFLTHIDEFRKIFDSNDAHKMPLPGQWDSKLNEFQKLIVLRCLRPDKMILAVMDWITLKLDRKFIIPPTFDLPTIFKDSSVTTPLICVLSPGSDPISAILRFAEEMGMAKKLDSISLGQGQGDRAQAFIEDAKGRGGWVLLQNCHLSKSWMPSLEKIVEEFDDSIHREFRLWLTSEPSPYFPVSTLQNGVKMTIEPPAGLRANLLLSYSRIDDKEFDTCAKPNEYKTLYFAFCFFHAIVQDRRKFGPIGWNIPYAFTNEDLDVTLMQLRLFMDDAEKPIPYKVLKILGADINYGGRVTDDKDIRLIRTILSVYITPKILEEDYKFSHSGTYYAPAPGRRDDYVRYIEGLPLDPSPEAFGMNENAQITTAQSETLNLLSNILSMQPRSSAAAGKSREEIIEELSQKIESEIPPLFDLEAVSTQYPTQYTESMNTVLIQEVQKYQRLLLRMVSSLADIQKALAGKLVMSEELEGMADSLFNNRVPALWSDVGFLSLKPLSSWFDDLQHRVKFMNDWINNGTPKVFWISGFFFPQAFITGNLQNYARKYFIAIDLLSFDFKVTDNFSMEEIKEKPEDGCYVAGLWLEGCRWDKENHTLASSFPKELYTPMPIMHFIPKADRTPPETGIYNCPVYKVLSRTGTLSTTGHSTNFVLFVELPSRDLEEVWIIAGVALFLALRN